MFSGGCRTVSIFLTAGLLLLLAWSLLPFPSYLRWFTKIWATPWNLRQPCAGNPNLLEAEGNYSRVLEWENLSSLTFCFHMMLILVILQSIRLWNVEESTQKGAWVERLHVNENLIIMKPPQRVHPHFTCPILPVPQPEKAGRMKRTSLGEYRLRALLSARQHVLTVSMPARPPHILYPVLTFPVIPPSLPEKTMCFQLLKNCSCFCPLAQYMVGGVNNKRMWLADLQFGRVQGRGMPWFPLHCQQTEKSQLSGFSHHFTFYGFFWRRASYSCPAFLLAWTRGLGWPYHSLEVPERSL